jgi:Nucleotidyltransferase domain
MFALPYHMNGVTEQRGFVNISEPSDLVMTRTTAAVLRVLAGADTAFTIRQTARLAGVSPPRALEIVDRAAARGLIVVEQAGRSRMCRFNRDHLAADAIITLVMLRQRMFAALAEQIRNWETPPLHSSLFGSAARGDGDIDSDLDVLVVRADSSSTDDWEAQKFASGRHIERLTGNSVNWFDISRSDLDRSVELAEPLVAEWLADGIPLVGQPLRALLRGSLPDRPAATPARPKRA